MNFFSFIDDDSVSEVRIKKKKIISDSSSANVRNIDIQLSIEVVYNSEFDSESDEKMFKEYIEYWLYQVKKNTLRPSSFDRKERTIIVTLLEIKRKI